MSQTPVRFKSGELQLEGVLYAPDGAEASAVVVVCHPHPQSGGEMRNNVVMAVAQALVECGISALTFNFRGVGYSEGAYDNGAGEQADVGAALAHASTLDGIERVGLAGYSFGAGMAASAFDDSVAALALVSAPAGRLRASKLASYVGPALLVAGDLDHIASVDAMRETAATMPGPVEVVAVPGVDHFWRGAEPRLREIVGPFFAAALIGSKTP